MPANLQFELQKIDHCPSILLEPPQSISCYPLIELGLHQLSSLPNVHCLLVKPVAHLSHSPRFPRPPLDTALSRNPLGITSTYGHGSSEDAPDHNYRQLAKLFNCRSGTFSSTVTTPSFSPKNLPLKLAPTLPIRFLRSRMSPTATLATSSLSTLSARTSVE